MGNPHVFYQLGILTEDVIQDVADEANRAHQKHQEDSMLFGGDDKSNRILVEEIGEVSKAMNEYMLGNKSMEEYDEELYTELVQSAAMCMTWAVKVRSQAALSCRIRPDQ